MEASVCRLKLEHRCGILTSFAARCRDQDGTRADMR